MATMRTNSLILERLQPRADEIPDVPMRRKLRPCCAFGHDIKLSLGKVPFPGYEIGNVLGFAELGRHSFDSGVLAIGGSLDGGPLTRSENNGLLYSCHGGFIDTAHVRDNVDWTILIAARIAQKMEQGVSFELPDEGGIRRIIVKPAPDELLERYELTAIALGLARWIAFELSVWHEIATWLGWSSVDFFPEKVSAFSPEDLYSNMLGTKVAFGIVRARYAGDEFTYNQGVDQWFLLFMHTLKVVPKQVAIDTITALDGHWWDSKRRLPDPRLTLRRNMETGNPIIPWLIPPELAPESLRKFCGDDPEPISLANPATALGNPFSEIATFEVEPSPLIMQSAVIEKYGPVISNRDFPAIIEEIRKQNRAEFGPRADRLD